MTKCLSFRLIIIFLSILLGILAWMTSVNKTEVGHLGSSVYFYKTFRYDVFNVNPPLTRMLTSFSCFLENPNYDWKSYSPRSQDRSEWSLGSAFINANSPEKVRRLVFIGRITLIGLILCGVWVGCKFSSQLFSPSSGLVFLGLWAFSPLPLAWSATICPDVLAAILGLIGIYTLWKWLRFPTFGNVFLAGITLGFMLLTKLTWIIAFPIYFIIWMLWHFIPDRETQEKIGNDSCKTLDRHELPVTIPKNPSSKQLLVLFCAGIYILNMGYLFDGTFTQLRDFKFMSGSLSGNNLDDETKTCVVGNRFDGSRQSYERILGYLPLPFPKDYVQGIDTQKYDFERGIESFLNGEFSSHGWKSYYFYVLLYKEPIGFMALFAIAIGTTFFKKYRLKKDEIVILVPFVTLFVFISWQNGISVHPRYILPCYPFMYLFTSRTGRLFVSNIKATHCKNATKVRPGFCLCAIRSFAIILLAWGCVSCLLQFPHSMSYFNELIGAKNGAYYLQGSNLDWGQNEYFFRKWCYNHNKITLYTNYLTKNDAERLGINNLDIFTSLSQENVKPGWYAVGVNDLYGKSSPFKNFQRFEPVDRIGVSINIYHLSQNDIDQLFVTSSKNRSL